MHKLASSKKNSQMYNSSDSDDEDAGLGKGSNYYNSSHQQHSKHNNNKSSYGYADKSSDFYKGDHYSSSGGGKFFKGNSRNTNKYQTVVLRVQIHCEGCTRRVKKALAGVDGVESMSVDVKHGRVSVTGYVDPQKLLKKVAKTGKYVEFASSNNNSKTSKAHDNYNYGSYDNRKAFDTYNNNSRGSESKKKGSEDHYNNNNHSNSKGAENYNNKKGFENYKNEKGVDNYSSKKKSFENYGDDYGRSSSKKSFENYGDDYGRSSSKSMIMPFEHHRQPSNKGYAKHGSSTNYDDDYYVYKNNYASNNSYNNDYTYKNKYANSYNEEDYIYKSRMQGMTPQVHSNVDYMFSEDNAESCSIM